MNKYRLSIIILLTLTIISINLLIISIFDPILIEQYFLNRILPIINITAFIYSFIIWKVSRERQTFQYKIIQVFLFINIVIMFLSIFFVPLELTK